MTDMTPETLESFEFSIPSDPALAEALRLWVYRHRCAWEADRESLRIVRKTVKMQRDVVILLEARIEALEKVKQKSRLLYVAKRVLTGNLDLGDLRIAVDEHVALAAEETP